MNSLEQELESFIKYVEEWFPTIGALRVFGSYLCKDEPRDVDVLALFVGDYQPSRETFNQFPHIHYCKELHFEGGTKPITKPLWTRKDGLVEIHPRVSETEYLRAEVSDLRVQLKETRQELRSRCPVRTITGYGDSYSDPY